jgi:hypothetical protein
LFESICSHIPLKELALGLQMSILHKAFEQGYVPFLVKLSYLKVKEHHK